MTRPLAIDLFCGLGGWTDGLLAAGYDVVGFDIQAHRYGDYRYPAKLVLQDIRTIDGARFKDATLIVASPPCQRYSWMAMPWKAAKAKAAWYDDPAHPERRKELNQLFDACWRIQREACAAAGRHIPLVIENVCGAQRWVGRARWHYGSYYLWGDVPALMPIQKPRRNVVGLDLSSQDDATQRRFRDSATKNTGGSWFAVAHNTKTRNDPRDKLAIGRKAASALIAKIPFTLAKWIGMAWINRT